MAFFQNLDVNTDENVFDEEEMVVKVSKNCCFFYWPSVINALKKNDALKTFFDNLIDLKFVSQVSN